MPGNYLRYNEFEFNQGPLLGKPGGVSHGLSTVSGTLTLVIFKLVKGSANGSSSPRANAGVKYAVGSTINTKSKVRLNIYGKLNNLGLTLNGVPVQLSNVNRSMKIGYRIIGLEDRMATGKLVRRDINRKRTFAISWKWLPYRDQDVLDRGAGAATLYQIWRANSLVTLTIPDGVNGELQDYVCFFEQNGLRRNIQHIGSREYWNVDMTFREA